MAVEHTGEDTCLVAFVTTRVCVDKGLFPGHLDFFSSNYLVWAESRDASGGAPVLEAAAEPGNDALRSQTHHRPRAYPRTGSRCSWQRLPLNPITMLIS